MNQFQNLYTKGFQAWKAQAICEIHLLATIFDKMTQCNIDTQGTKIFQYCTCPAGRVTYNFDSSFKHVHLSFNAIENIRE